MNHQEAKDLLSKLLPQDQLSLIKVEVFRLSWEGKGYNIISDETGYDHDYVRKAGSQLWKELSDKLDVSVTKRNFRGLLEDQLASQKNESAKSLEYPGGIMVFSSPLYIERTDEEQQCYSEIERPGAMIRIKGPRKMGKSSLMLRVLDHADSEGYKTVSVDFQKADRSILSDLDKLLRWLCYQVATQLNLSTDVSADINEHWNELLGSKLSCTNFLQDQILAKLDQPLVLVINELNLIFDHQEVSQDFLPLLRSWFEEAKHQPDMSKLRQVLIYSTEVYVQLDLNLSPFNVGLPIELKPFNAEQLESLANAYGFNWKKENTAASPINYLLLALGGHPYLSQLALYKLATLPGLIESPSQALREVLADAVQQGGVFEDFLQRMLSDLNSSDALKAAFEQVFDGETDQVERSLSYQLQQMGLVSIADNELVLSSELVATYLSDHIS